MELKWEWVGTAYHGVTVKVSWAPLSSEVLGWAGRRLLWGGGGPGRPQLLEVCPIKTVPHPFPLTKPLIRIGFSIFVFQGD